MVQLSRWDLNHMGSTSVILRASKTSALFLLPQRTLSSAYEKKMKNSCDLYQYFSHQHALYLQFVFSFSIEKPFCKLPIFPDWNVPQFSIETKNTAQSGSEVTFTQHDTFNHHSFRVSNYPIRAYKFTFHYYLIFL